MVAYMCLPGLRNKEKLPITIKHTPEYIENAVMDFYNLRSLYKWQKRDKHDKVLARSMAVLMLRHYTNLTLRTIGERYGLDYASVWSAIQAIRERIRTDDLIRSHKDIIEAEIFN